MKNGPGVKSLDDTRVATGRELCWMPLAHRPQYSGSSNGSVLHWGTGRVQAPFTPSIHGQFKTLYKNLSTQHQGGGGGEEPISKFSLVLGTSIELQKVCSDHLTLKCNRSNYHFSCNLFVSHPLLIAVLPTFYSGIGYYFLEKS